MKCQMDWRNRPFYFCFSVFAAFMIPQWTMINNVSKINHDEKSSFSYSEPRSCQIENSDHVTNLAIISTWDHTLFRTIVSELYCIVMIFKKKTRNINTKIVYPFVHIFSDLWLNVWAWLEVWGNLKSLS